MVLQRTEDEALHFPREDRAQVIQPLILKFEALSEEELRSDGSPEFRLRAEVLGSGSVKALPRGGVLRKAGALGMA